MDYLNNEVLTATQANNAINNIVGMTSTASKIDYQVQNGQIKKQSDYIKNIRKFKDLSGVSITLDSSGLSTLEATSDNTLKIKTNGSTSLIRAMIDLSNYGEGFVVGEQKNIGIKVKVTNWDKLSYVNVNLWSSSAGTQGYNNSFIQAPSVITRDGIYYIPILDKDFSVYLGSPATLSMNYLRFEITPLAGNSTGASLELEIMDVVKFKPKKSKCMISFDDGHSSCLEIADLLDARGLKGTFYIYNQGIGQSGNITLAQLKDLYNRGHDIGVHNNKHESLITQGEDLYLAGQQECRRWIRDNIGDSAHNHAAYVGGFTTHSLIERMEKANFRSMRKANPAGKFVHSGWGCGIDNKWSNPRFASSVYEMNNTQTRAIIQAAHQNAIDYNQDFFVYGHQILGVEAAQAWSRVIGSPYSMPDYLDWVKSKVDDGSIEVLTVSQFWNEYENYN